MTPLSIHHILGVKAVLFITYGACTSCILSLCGSPGSLGCFSVDILLT